MSSYLKISGTKVVDGEGKEIILRGAGLGGWMKYVVSILFFESDVKELMWCSSMENFISGYPGCEFQIRETLADTIGAEKSELFFDKVR